MQYQQRINIELFEIIDIINDKIIAIILFPGGNHLDSTQEGYDFTLNFFSELGFYKTFSEDEKTLTAMAV